jgi:hypothetical protein
MLTINTSQCLVKIIAMLRRTHLNIICSTQVDSQLYFIHVANTEIK